MFDVLIREVATRFGLGDKARELVQVMLASMLNKDTGGLAGFLEKFNAAGLGPVVQSWLGNTVSPQPVTNSQVEQVLGGTGGLLSLLTSRLNAPRDSVTSAVGYLLPALVAKLTPGGSMPAGVPADVQALIGDGRSFLGAPALAAAAPAAASGGGFGKWLPWIIGAAAVLLGLSFCNKKPATTEPTPVVPASAAASAPASVPVVPVAPASEPASVPAASASLDAPASAPTVALEAAPEHAAVIAGQAHGVPMLQVFFDVSKTDVAAEFADKSKDLVEYLKSHDAAKAVISGFNDPTGNAAKNAELSKNRAQAVQAALEAAGIAKDRLVLEKPAEASGTGVTNAASRRVDVTIRE